MTLQPIKLIDSNKKIKNLGDNVYGYLYAACLRKVDEYFNPLDLSIVSDEGRQYEKNNHFLIKKYSDTKITFEGYVSNEVDSLLNQSKNVFNLDIMVYPVPFIEFNVAREFDLNDKDLQVRSRFISPEYGYHQWLVDVTRKISVQPSNALPKDETNRTFAKDKAEGVFYKKPEFIITSMLALISIPWWPTWLTKIKSFFNLLCDIIIGNNI